jgi:hypothetical protein
MVALVSRLLLYLHWPYIGIRKQVALLKEGEGIAKEGDTSHTDRVLGLLPGARLLSLAIEACSKDASVAGGALAGIKDGLLLLQLECP